MVTHSLGVALITGASTGIGAVYADRLAHRGYDLLLVARDRVRMETLAARLKTETGRAIEVLPANLTDEASLAGVERRLATDPQVAVLVNNAGLSLNDGLLGSSPEQIKRLIALNITAPTILAAAGSECVQAEGGGRYHQHRLGCGARARTCGRNLRRVEGVPAQTEPEACGRFERGRRPGPGRPSRRCPHRDLATVGQGR